jgi:D-beta-D-heptose 7-phosphate kinase/D-beta-D-heptose 1-phosphate adenosyltransferase
MTINDLKRAGKELLRYLKLDSLLITLGEEGMYLFEASQITHIPTQAQEVFDVSGAGDTVVANFTLSLACGASKLEAAHIANLAAGIVVSKIGTATISRKELLERISKI